MIKFILKFINSNETREVFMDEQTFSEYSDGINKENIEGLEPESLNIILDLKDNDYKIQYVNVKSRVVLNHDFNIKINEPFFEEFPIFNELFLRDVLETIKEHSDCKFDIFVFQDDVLMHLFKVTMIRTPNSYICLSSPKLRFKQFEQISPRVLESSSEALCIFQNHKIVYANKSFANLVSKTLEQLDDMEILPGDDFPGADDAKLLEAFDNLRAGNSFYYDQELKTKINGEERFFKIFLSSMTYRNNQAIQLTAIDTTKQNILNEISFSTNNEIQTLRSIGNIAVFKQESSATDISWSPEYLTIMGSLPSSKSLKYDLFDYIIIEDKNLFEKTWIKSIRSKTDVISEFRIKTAEDKIKYLYLYSKMKYEDNGRILSINGFIQDRTEINESRHKLLNELDQREIAIKEMHKESQDILDNILDQTDLELNSEEFTPKFIVEKNQNRRNALNIIQEKIHESPNISSINLVDVLTPFIKTQIKFYNVNNVDFNVKVLANVSVSRKTAIVMALIINEIIDNIIREVSTYHEEEVIIRVDLNVNEDIFINVETSVINIYGKSDLSTKVLKNLVKELNGNLKVKREKFNTLIDVVLESEK